MKNEYIIIEHEMKYPGDAVEFKCSSSIGRILAEEAAEHDFHCCDGWESRWPLTFEIFVEGKSIGRFSVDVRQVPEFHARELKEIGR